MLTLQIVVDCRLVHFLSLLRGLDLFFNVLQVDRVSFFSSNLSYSTLAAFSTLCVAERNKTNQTLLRNCILHVLQRTSDLIYLLSSLAFASITTSGVLFFGGGWVRSGSQRLVWPDEGCLFHGLLLEGGVVGGWDIHHPFTRREQHWGGLSVLDWGTRADHH